MAIFGYQINCQYLPLLIKIWLQQIAFMIEITFDIHNLVMGGGQGCLDSFAGENSFPHWSLSGMVASGMKGAIFTLLCLLLYDRLVF